MSNPKDNIGWDQNLKPLLDSYVRRLFKELEVENIILADIQRPGTYRLNNIAIGEESTTITTTTTIPPTSQNVLFRTLFDLRNITKAVYQNLDYNDSKHSHSFQLSRLLEKLEEDKAFTVRWKNKAEILDILDKLDNLSNDPAIEKGIDKSLIDNNFNPNTIITELLEFFGRQKVIHNFGDNVSQIIAPSKNDISEWIVLNHSKVGDLYFNFKLRRTEPVPDKESLLQAIRQLENVDSPSYAFLVVFTYENPGAVDKLKFQFRQILLNDLQEFTNYTDRIKFIPIFINDMSLIDREFDEFKRTYVEDELDFVFRNQPTPRGFNERNDHFLERNFDVRTTQFKIEIEPIETSFWRFGFRFIQNETFPPTAQPRHENVEVGDIHICVGDLITSDTNDFQWEKSNQLVLTEYHAEVIQNDFVEGITNYKGSPVSLLVDPNNDASRVVVSVQINGQVVGKKIYNLSKFKYCRISAWRDYGAFELKTKIQINHNRTGF